MDNKTLDCYQMVRDAVAYISVSDGVTREEAFDKLLSYLAVNLYLNSEKGVSFKEDTLTVLDIAFKFDLLKEVKEDVLGKVYAEIFKPKKQKLSNLDNVFTTSDSDFPSAVFVHSIGTAAMLIGKSPNVLVYTMTNDINVYHISLINRALHNLSLFSLFIGNKKVKELNVDIKNPSWEFANKWNPVKSSHLV